MNYIAFDLLYKLGLSFDDYCILTMISQTESHLLPNNQEFYKKYEDLGYIQYLKGNKSLSERVRISAKGKKALYSISKVDGFIEAEELAEKMVSLYKAYDLSTRLGKFNEFISLLSWFLKVTGFKPEMVYKVFKDNIGELANKGKLEYAPKLTNLICKHDSVFQHKLTLDKSTLYDWFCTSYEFGRNIKLWDNMDKKEKYYVSVVKALPLKKMNKDDYFTGSYEGDMKQIEKIRAKILEKLREPTIFAINKK